MGGKPHPGQVPPEAARAQVDRVLASAVFQKAPRLSRLLEFLATETLAARGDELKEYTVGMGVFDRPEGFDPRDDSIVRSSTHRLRERLSEYYANDGANDSIIVTVPLQGYVTEFCRRVADPPPPPPPPPTKPWWLWIVLAGVLAAAAWIVFPRATPVPATLATPPPVRRLFWAATAEGGQFERIALPKAGWEPVVSRDGRKVYIRAMGERQLMVVDLAGGRFDHMIELPEGARVIRLSADGKKLYVGLASPGILVIDLAEERPEAARIATPHEVWAIEPTPDGRKLFVGLGNHGLGRIDLASREFKLLTPMRWAGHLQLDHRGKNLYVAWEGGGPGGRPGHDALERWDIAGEKPAGATQGPPMVGDQLTISADDERLLMFSRDACSDPAYDHTGCPPAPPGGGPPIRPAHLWRLPDLKLVASLEFPGSYLGRFFPSTPRVFFGGTWGNWIWNWTTGRVLERFVIPQDYQRPDFLPNEEGAVVTSPLMPELLVLWAEPLKCLPPAGVVNSYPFDGTLDDSAGGGRPVVQGKTEFVPGLAGQALRLDGETGSLTGLNGAEWCHACLGTSTQALFVRFDAGGQNGTVLEFLPDEKARKFSGFRLAREGSRLILASLPAQGGDGPRIASLAPVPVNQWVHVAVVEDRGKRELYVDGVRQGGHAVEAGVNDRGAGWLGASRGARDFLKGRLDEVLVYGRVLSDAEIKHLAARGQCR